MMLDVQIVSGPLVRVNLDAVIGASYPPDPSQLRLHFDAADLTAFVLVERSPSLANLLGVAEPPR